MDVDQEFIDKQIEADKKNRTGKPAPKAATKKGPDYHSLDLGDEDGFGFTREKSKNLLLNSQQ
jgi:hypothetical protein